MATKCLRSTYAFGQESLQSDFSFATAPVPRANTLVCVLRHPRESLNHEQPEPFKAPSPLVWTLTNQIQPPQVFIWDTEGIVEFHDTVCSHNTAVARVESKGGCIFTDGNGIFNTGTTMEGNVAGKGGCICE